MISTPADVAAPARTPKAGFPADFKAGLVRPGDNGHVWIMSDKLRPILDARTTGGGLDVFEATVGYGGGPPPHMHTIADETFVILEGKYRFLADRTWHTAEAGDIFHAPKNVMHSFRGASHGTNRMLILVTPANFAPFVEACCTPEEQQLTPELIGPFVETCGRHDITLRPDWETDGAWDEGL